MKQAVLLAAGPISHPEQLTVPEEAFLVCADAGYRYAQALGQAFQIRDDVLDVTSTPEELGKPIGSDRSNEKSTFVTALGLEGCQAEIARLTREAVDALEGFEHPEFHIWLAGRLAGRSK